MFICYSICIYSICRLKVTNKPSADLGAIHAALLSKAKLCRSFPNEKPYTSPARRSKEAGATLYISLIAYSQISTIGIWSNKLGVQDGMVRASRLDGQEDIFRKRGEGLLLNTDPHWPATGTYAAHRTFMKELY
jgi:hypothetical protein